MKRRIVLLCAAALLALAGTGAVLAYVAGADDRALANTRSAEVLIASGQIAKGTSFAQARADGLVTSARFPVSALPPDALATSEGIADGAVATQDVAARQILLAGTFGPATQSEDVAGLTLPAGASAVPVSMKAFTGYEAWAGWVRPGSEIAIYLTFRNRVGDTEPYVPGAGLGKGAGTEDASSHEVTRLLLDRVTVLAVGAGPSTGEESGSGSSEGGSAMILALTQEQSERLIMGVAREGLLYPALLTPGSKIAPSPGTLDNEIFNPLTTPVPRGAVRP